MRLLLACALLAVLASAARVVSSDPAYAAFAQWAKRHGKIYTAAEEARRFAVFKENSAVIERLNLEPHGSAVFGANQFTDLTSAEYKSAVTTRLGKHAQGSVHVYRDDHNDTLDMTSYLPPVKNQGFCGSCWAFSAVANMEGQTYLKTNKVQALSEQQLVSCDQEDNGCSGGWMAAAHSYVVKQGGIASEGDYPYVSGGGYVPACKKKTSVAARFRSSIDLGTVADDVTIIEHLHKYGPLSVAIQADRPVFQNYAHGVIDSAACGTQLDHGVALVGYGTEEASGTKYWLVRNSWGSTWGDRGYVKLARGKNMCGINTELATIVA